MSNELKSPSVLDASELESTSSEDRREHERSNYECVQLVAYCKADDSRPQQAEFQHRLCHDISSSGLSFIDFEPPKCEFAIVALGELPWQIMRMQIANIMPCWRNGRRVFRIGCRFLERVK